ncbi:hypothetical protein ACHAXH_009068 [Discostella pseudostelligera]
MTMTSTYLLVLTAVLSAAASSSSLLFVDAFSPIAVVHHTTPSSRLISAPLGMGIFDAFQKAFSNEAYGDPPEAIKATARHILVPSLEDANRVLSEIGKGETSFAALANQYSTCPSKSRGGSLGSFGPGTMVKEFDEVVFSTETKVGQVMGPVKTQFGYHLLVVDKRSGGSDWY